MNTKELYQLIETIESGIKSVNESLDKLHLEYTTRLQFKQLNELRTLQIKEIKSLVDNLDSRLKAVEES